MNWEHVLSQSASCMQRYEWHQRCGCLMAALPAGWSRMASVAISPSSIEKNQAVPLCPKSQASAVQVVRGTVALGLSSRGTAASCSSSLPSKDKEELNIFPQGVSNTSNLHALKKTFHISPPCTSAPVEVIFAKAVLCLCKLSFLLACSS